jgi:hypothetical protein
MVDAYNNSNIINNNNNGSGSGTAPLSTGQKKGHRFPCCLCKSEFMRPEVKKKKKNSESIERKPLNPRNGGVGVVFVLVGLNLKDMSHLFSSMPRLLLAG